MILALRNFNGIAVSSKLNVTDKAQIPGETDKIPLDIIPPDKIPRSRTKSLGLLLNVRYDNSEKYVSQYKLDALTNCISRPKLYSMKLRDCYTKPKHAN